MNSSHHEPKPDKYSVETLDVLARYREAWQEVTTGKARPVLEDYLQQVAAEDRDAVRQELESIDASCGAGEEHDTNPGETDRTILVDSIDESVSAKDEAEPADDSTDLIGTEPKGGISRADAIRESVRGLRDYEVLSELGRGGMGIVFKAREKSVNRVVALKMLLTGALASQESVRRFRVEAEAVASLDHPGIIPVYHVDEFNGMPFFAMKFVDGASLDQDVRFKFKQPRAAAELMRKVCQAVDYAHKRGILHRDLKPGNILIDKEGEPHITDFGLAKRLDEEKGATSDGTVMGTPDYMAPEQAKGDLGKISVASDVYSLGSIFFDLLTGEPPFRSATVMETLIRVANEPAPAPRSLNNSVDADLETICMKCLEKEPDHRYGSAQDVADELDRYLTGRPIEARPVGRVERARLWCRRNPVVASLLGAVAALLVAWLVVLNMAIVRISREKQATEEALLLARSNEAFAQRTLHSVMATVHDNLRDQVDPRKIRQSVLRIAEQQLESFKDREQKPLTPEESADLLRRTQAAMYQRIADSFFEVGRTKEAMANYQQMAVLIKQMYDVAPDSPQSQKFMAACVNKLGDTYYQLGQFSAALDSYQEALRYRKDWVALLEQQPDTEAYALMNAKWQVSVSCLLVCRVHLHLGQSQAAARVLDDSRPWAAAVLGAGELAITKEFLSLFQSANDFLEMANRFETEGDVSLALESVASSKEHYGNAITILEEGIGREKITKLRLRRELVRCRLKLGDVYLRYDRDDAKAEREYLKAEVIAKELNRRDAESIDTLRLLGAVYDRLGMVAATRDEPILRKERLEKALETHEQSVKQASQNMLARIDLMMALARIGRHVEATEIAAAVKESVDDPAGAYAVAKCYAVCSEVVEDQKLQQSYRDAAFEAVRAARQTGWKDLRTAESDPDLVAIDVAKAFAESEQ